MIIEKSQWDPVQNLEFLGIEIDTKSNKLSVPKQRIDKAFSTIQNVKDNIRYYKGTKVRLLASLVGQLISMYVVVGNMIYIMTKVHRYSDCLKPALGQCSSVEYKHY